MNPRQCVQSPFGNFSAGTRSSGCIYLEKEKITAAETEKERLYLIRKRFKPKHLTQ